MASCRLLELCRELRDIIYEYALLDDRLESNGELGLAATKEGAAGWQLQTQLLQTPTWLSLVQTGNRQLHAEVTDFLARRQRRPNIVEPATAKATLVLTHPSCSVHWDRLPLPPTQLPILDLHVKISNMFGSAIRPPSGALAEAIVQVIARYRSHGPRLNRENPLERQIKLERVRITLAAPADQSCCYGNPWMQLRSHYSCLKWALGEIARERMGKGIGGMAVEARIEGRVWESVVGKGQEKVTRG